MKYKENYIIYISLLLLSIISTINLYNARFLNIYYNNYYIKQLLWISIGVLLIFILNKKIFKLIFKYSYIFYWINVILLIVVLFFSKSINGARAWIDFGFFSIQPSEFMKFFLTIYLIQISQRKIKREKKIVRMIIITLIPSLLVFLEPDTGAIIFYFIIWLYLISTLKIKWQFYIVLLIGLTFSLSIFIWLYLNNQDILMKYLGTSFFYRVDRFINFRNNNYQLELSLISIFASSPIRNGLNNILIYIPEGATDFIFAFCIGNFGLMLGIIIIFCYIFLLWNILKKVKTYQDKKTNYLIISFSLILFFQVLINILMNIGLIPIIGITLPFVSYGGSSTILSFLFLSSIINLTSKDDKEHSKNKNN